jgi:hypothetical protein
VPPLVKIETPLGPPLFSPGQQQHGEAHSGHIVGPDGLRQDVRASGSRTRTYIEGGKIATPQQKTIAGGNC